MSSQTYLGDGRYRLCDDAPMASGFHSSVWKARDLELGRTVAIKLFDQEPTLMSPEDEARRLARLNHPGVVRVERHLADADGRGTEAVVMEYVPGPTLEQTLGKPFSVETTLTILGQIAAALQLAHCTLEDRQAIVHGDIHPANLILERVGPTPQVRVTDWGTIPPGGGSGPFGHDMYRAPEAWVQVEPASDFWSLGLVGVSVAAGRRIVPADVKDESSRRSLAVRDEALRMNCGVASPEFRELIEGLLQPDPRLRADHTNIAEAIKDAGGDGGSCLHASRRTPPGPAGAAPRSGRSR